MSQVRHLFGPQAHLYWLRVQGGVPGRKLGAPGEDGELSVGVILGPGPSGQEVVLRTVTSVVDRAARQALDEAINTGVLPLPASGVVLDSSSLLTLNQVVTQASGAR